MSISTLPLNGLRAFEAAGRHLSFKLAAEELNVTPAAVSHQIRALEERLGHELFIRHHRVLELSPAGHLLLPGLRDGLLVLERSVRRLSTLGSERRLIIAASPTFAARWLLPRVQDFQEQYPDLEVHISTSPHVVDLESHEADVALRYGTGNYPGLHVEPLMDEGMTAVCSPALLDGEHPLKRPEDLVHHTLLHDRSWGYVGSAPDWDMWLRTLGATGVDASKGPHFDMATMALAAAVLGRGVALTTRSLVADDLAAGLLVTPFDLSVPLDARMYFVCLPEALERPAVAAFHAWVFKMAEETLHPPENG
jgi:LysR family glycine cleavage system transcriptional activator